MFKMWKYCKFKEIIKIILDQVRIFSQDSYIWILPHAEVVYWVDIYSLQLKQRQPLINLELKKKYFFIKC